MRLRSIVILYFVILPLRMLFMMTIIFLAIGIWDTLSLGQITKAFLIKIAGVCLLFHISMEKMKKECLSVLDFIFSIINLFLKMVYYFTRVIIMLSVFRKYISTPPRRTARFGCSYYGACWCGCCWCHKLIFS